MTGLGLNTRNNENPVSASSNSNMPNSHNDHHSNDSLFQVMKAVEAAEATIKQQVEENTRLRTELQMTMQELEKVKIGEPVALGSHSAHPWNERIHSRYEVYQSDLIGNPEDKARSMNSNSAVDPSSLMVSHQGLKPNTENTSQVHVENHSDRSNSNGRLKASPDRHALESSNLSQFSSPSPASVSPGRYQIEGDYEPQLNVPGHGTMQMAEVNNSNSLLKQDFVLKVHEHEEEIVQLRKRLADYSVKETQIRNEKYVLEKRIAYMRLAFAQQQQDLVDAASKALSYRQDIIEENIRLTYELQALALMAAQQERSTFVTSLMPLLADYSLQPPVPDAQSIISNVRVLFRHLQEKLIFTEVRGGIKAQRIPVSIDTMAFRCESFQCYIAVPSSFNGRRIGDYSWLMYTFRLLLMYANLLSMFLIFGVQNKNGLEFVPRPTYARANAAMASSDVQTAADWDIPSHNQSGFGGGIPKNQEINDGGRYSPLASRNTPARDLPEQFAVTRGDSPAMQYNGDNTKQVTFCDSVSNSEMDDLEAEVQLNDREAQSNWGSGTPYTTTIDDPTSSYSPYLPPVLEEPSSSFSEGLPMTILYQPSRAFKFQVMHFLAESSMHVDTLLTEQLVVILSGCAILKMDLLIILMVFHFMMYFEFILYYIDFPTQVIFGVIPGAKQPNYLVTADDVDTYLVIEVQPLDDRRRKGELVRVFANENKKITCDVEMLNHIERNFSNGHVAYKISLSTGYLDIWEPATLVIKRDSYTIKSGGPNGGVVVSEKFSSKISVGVPHFDMISFPFFMHHDSEVTIPYGHPVEFVIVCATGGQHMLRTDNDAADVSCSRDIIVLTMRLFIIKAGEKRKGKKRGLFFNK
ncbi:unnamed protein product [Linum tenue]|uniref:DUF7046 domain-containing protein n=1 Tax=Linum tenue TaxID=586396 RepID=A0AAV0J5V9_9ROSI|nr:unnamed protein product [Linum tenue]